MRWGLERRSGYPARGARRTLGRAGIAVALSLAGLAAVPLSLGSCTATRNADGSITLTFAPDMTITALGLEDARDQVFGLLEACTAGTFPRPCTSQEKADLLQSYNEILARKAELGRKTGEHDDAGASGV